jgi:hypothetical protein
MSSTDALQARVAALAAGTQPTPPASDPIVVTSILNAALANKANAQDTLTALNGKLDASDYSDRSGPHIFDFIQPSYHSAILAGTSTDDVTSGFQAAATALANTALEGDARGKRLRIVGGLYNLSASVTFGGVGLSLVGDGIAATVLAARADLGADKALIEMRQTRTNYSAIGIGAAGLRIDMMGRQGHGLRLWKAYDGVDVSRIKIDNVADATHGLMIVPDPTVNSGDPYSQTVAVRNVNAYHKNVTATASLFYFEALNEALIELCKGFGTYYANTSGGTVFPSVNAFELVDCGGVNLIQCSGAMSAEHAFLVRSTGGNRFSRSVVIDTPTIELQRGALKCVGAGTTNDDAYKVLEVELRSPRIVQPYTTHPSGDVRLSSTRGAVIDAKSLTVAMTDTDRCRIRSDGTKANVTGNGSGDRIEFLPSQFPRTSILVAPATAQTIPSGAFTAVAYGSVTTDAAGEWNPSTSVFTTGRSGRYNLEIGCQYNPAAATAGAIALVIVKNGVQFKRLFTRYNAWTYGTQGVSSAVLDLAAGDTIYLQFYADMGATLPNDATQNYLRITPVNNGYAL